MHNPRTFGCSSSCPTDAWLTFEAVPTCSNLTLGGAVFIAQSRFYLLLPQLLRLDGTPGIVDDPVHPGAGSFSVPADLSYEADVCRQCPDAVCDRHLIHAHACRKTSKPKIRDRHELVKMVRADMVAEAGFSGVKVEPRTDYDRDQRRADIFYIDNSAPRKHIHYYSDDTVGHPLSPSHLGAELKDSSHTLGHLERHKEAQYRTSLASARLHQAVLRGTRVIKYRTCAYTSLGALGAGAGKDINCAARLYKLMVEREVRRARRLDGMTVEQLAAAFRKRYRARIQIALATGNGFIALAVGI